MHKNKRDDIYKIIWGITKIILSLRLLMFLCMQINELHILFLFFKQIINDPLHANKWNENLTRKGLDAYKLQKHWRKIYWISITSKIFLVKWHVQLGFPLISYYSNLLLQVYDIHININEKKKHPCFMLYVCQLERLHAWWHIRSSPSCLVYEFF
jgi:hypothetical protein